MQTRQDHVQAYKFASNRLATALVTGSAGPGDAPFRRSVLGVIVGVIISALFCGGFVVYGLIKPVPGAWRQQGAIVVDKQTGTRFMYLNGTLHPTANYASALLLVGQNATVEMVAHASLAGVPVGNTIGIAGAPQTLPATLLPGAWAECLAPAGPSGNAVVLDLAPSRHVTGSTAGQLILVAGPTGTQYVLWDNTKYLVPQRSALVAFGLGNQTPMNAPSSWLGAIPSGPALAPPTIAGRGKEGPSVAGQPMRIGTVFEVSAAGADQYYVLLRDGLAPLSHTAAALLTVSGFGPLQQVSPAVVASAPASLNRSLLNSLPDLLSGTAYQPKGAALCLRQTSPGSASGTMVITDEAAATATGVIVPAGTGMLVQPPAPKSRSFLPPTPPTYLVTDQGIKYVLADTGVLADFGYSGITPHTVPVSVLDLIPSGPALSTSVARRGVNRLWGVTVGGPCVGCGMGTCLWRRGRERAWGGWREGWHGIGSMWWWWRAVGCRRGDGRGWRMRWRMCWGGLRGGCG
jgi:type VII secretion protein EccB